MTHKKKNYFDRVLDKLKLSYSENEVVKLVSKKLSETEFELGVVISERDELQHRLNDSEKEVKRLRSIEKLYDEAIATSKKVANENRAIKIELEEKNAEIQSLLNKLY